MAGGRTPGDGPSGSARATPSSSSRPNTTPPPAALTNAIDYLYEEWGGKPVGYVGYGIFGAVMAVQKLRAQAGPLRMADIGPQVALSLREDFVDFAEFRPQELHVAEVHGLVDELLAWARALGPLRGASRAAA
ncbi:NADPH-dependent FMN reductase [Streptomyces sp. NPDC050564]|uniref:NADPH-dependent FMN reductase n=1 Tax=Streptomyces sp. NPDC050564 TaxID=3365631 RepID=UPI003791FFFD